MRYSPHANLVPYIHSSDLIHLGIIAYLTDKTGCLLTKNIFILGFGVNNLNDQLSNFKFPRPFAQRVQEMTLTSWKD